jgi:hypothetical protein
MKSWIRDYTLDDTVKVIKRLANICKESGGPLSCELNHMVQTEDWASLINYSFDYMRPTTSDDFLYARQIQALVSKQDFLDIGVDRELVAYKVPSI